MPGKNIVPRTNGWKNLNPLFHLTRQALAHAQPPPPETKEVTMKIITSWCSNIVFDGEGNRNNLLTARLDIPPFGSRIILARTEATWSITPLRQLDLLVAAQPFPDTRSVDLRPMPSSGKAIITFGLWDEAYQEIVKAAAGNAAIRFFISFTVEVERHQATLYADRAYAGTLQMLGPYTPLGQEPLFELIF